VLAHWLGRESFHGGGFVAGDGVWGVLGEKGDGKSTLLASLALSGVPIVADDRRTFGGS
jgi:ABC-type molybdenum transport system ATPase subunit/photorepair protein PhrA